MSARRAAVPVRRGRPPYNIPPLIRPIAINGEEEFASPAAFLRISPWLSPGSRSESDASLKFPHLHIGKDRGEGPATAAILDAGGADGLPAFAIRYWSSRGSSSMPVFITWLLGVGRFCLTVKCGLSSLSGKGWYIEAWPGARSVQSPLDQAQVESMRVSQVLQLRLGRSVPVAPAWSSPTWSATDASSV